MFRLPRGVAVAIERTLRFTALAVAGAGAVALSLVATQRIAAEKRPGQAAPVRPHPGLGITSSRLAAKVRAESLIFAGERFPAFDLERPARL